MTSLREIQDLDGTQLRYALMDLAKSVPNAIALGRGDPDLATPAHIVEAADRALQDGRLPIAPVGGLAELREAVANRASVDHGLVAEPHHVLITTGGQEALFLAVNAVLGPGDEVLVPDPRYTSYDQAIRNSGATSVPVPTYAEHGFDLRAEDVEARITERTKALLLVTPSNPTGGILTAENARRIADLARSHGFIVLADEIYGRFVWPPYESVSIGSLPGMSDRTITIGGLSKTYAMTGWRVGYVIAPTNVIEAMSRLKASTTGPVSTLSQIAALTALGPDQACVEGFRTVYLERRRILADGLASMGLSYGDPRGGFFFWVNSRSTGLRALELSFLLLKEAQVLIFPGTAFGDAWEDYLRITTLQPTDVLEEAVARMRPVVTRHAGGGRS